METELFIALSRIKGTRQGLESLDLSGPYARGWVEALAWAELAISTPAGDELAPVPASALDAR